VTIDLIIRGFCCVRPGVAGLTESIRVLDHWPVPGTLPNLSLRERKRCTREEDLLIGAADWMFKNLSKRIEVVTPVRAPRAKKKLWEVLDICLLRDRRQAWTLDAEGRYTQLVAEGNGTGPETPGAHQVLMQLTTDRLVD
jgi:polyphosphate kinase